MKLSNEDVQALLNEHDKKEVIALNVFLEKNPINKLSDELQKSIVVSFKAGFLYGVTSK